MLVRAALERLLKPGVNFIIVLQAVFTRVDPESTKKTDDLNVFFALLGSAGTIVACKMLMKLTPEVDFTNILRAAFFARRSQKHKKTLRT